jgi:RNA polymerase sigma-B factor
MTQSMVQSTSPSFVTSTVESSGLSTGPSTDPSGSLGLSPLPEQRVASRAERRERRANISATLLERASATGDESERQRLLDEVVHLNMEVAESVSTRYRRRGVPDDDLTQVAYVGLVKAVRGFDPAYERDFLVYAVPTIRGEVRKYFRDRAWVIRPPRRLQELQSRLAVATEQLQQELGRSPRPAEVAAHLEEDIEDVIEALSANGCFTPTSLDRPLGDDGGFTLGDLVAGEDADVGAVDARQMLAPAMDGLCERDRRILYLRFFAQKTQSEIATEIGVTQMQVSRLLSRILADLRGAIGG